MQATTGITSIFHCPLERAFKSPMLCDVTKVHTGYGLMPKVTHCEDDETWGQPGGSRRVFMAKNPVFKGGEAALDTVLERIENKYWKIEVNRFTYWAMGFDSFVGEWQTDELPDGSVRVKYTYTLHWNNILTSPFNWLVTKTIWRIYMKHVLENVRKLAYSEAPYLHK